MESILKFITNSELSADLLDATINKTQDLNTLNALLDIKLKYLNNSSNHQKMSLDIQFIYTNDSDNINVVCTVLRKALLVTSDIREPLLGIATYINKNYDDQLQKYKIIHLLHNLIVFCSDQNNLDLLLLYLTPEFINSFLLNELLEKETKIQAYETLKFYFILLSITEKINCLNSVFEFCIQKNDLDVLCALLNYVSEEIIEDDRCFLTTDKFWLFLGSCISGTVSHIQKQAEYILIKCVKVLQKQNKNKYIFVSGDIKNTWDAFFMLLDIGREKQLHLIEPALDLLKYLANLSPLWQKCIYSIYLKHSQNSIIYQTAIHLLSQKYEEDHLKDLLKILLPAINKNEYSEISCETFRCLREFCSHLDKIEFEILIQEILQVSWNPLCFWKIIQSIFIFDKRFQININYFQDVITYAANLPHIYIRKECIQYLIYFFWDKKSFFKMYKILCALQKNNIDYLEYGTNCEISLDIIDFVINELLNLSDDCNDPSKAQLCFMFLRQLIYDVLSSPVSKYLNKLNPHIKLFTWDLYFQSFEEKSEQPIMLYKEIEHFLIQYFFEYLHKDTISSFLQVIGCLIKHAKYSPENAVKQIIEAIFNPENYNSNQIFVAFALLSRFYNLLPSNFYDKINGKNIGDYALERWRSRIVNERDERIVKEYVNLIFATNHDNISLEDTMLSIKVFTSMVECQSNEVLHKIYDKTSNLLAISESPDLVIDFINICHRNLKIVKRDQCFKGMVDKFIKVVYSPTYFFLNVKNVSIINKDLLELSGTYPIIRLDWIRAIHKLFTDQLKYFQEFLVIVVEMYLQGVTVTKESRTEFNVCQEALGDTTIGHDPWQLDESSNPNLINASSRLLALEVLLLIANHDTDLVINCLREKYLNYFKKRYFPGSEIHFQKLRITQALMMLVPYAIHSLKSRRQLSVFIYDCFLEEANQNCIKQLFNWILILLLRVEGFAVIEYIRRITTTPTPASASVLVSLAPAVYHLTVFGNEEAFHETIRLALPWTMEAQFKLRVYAQDLIRRLFKHAEQKKFKNFLEKYKHLEDCINNCIISTGKVYENTMKTDLLFLNDFDLVADNSLKTIFYDIPRLNHVCTSEWQNLYFYISKPEYLKDNKALFAKTPLNSESTTFSDAIDVYLSENKNQHIMDESEIVCSNIQKKIMPWKTALEYDSLKNKSNFILIASLIDKPQNLGGLSRTCEVFGIRTFVLNDTQILKNKEFTSLSMSSESWINVFEVKAKDLEDYILKCQKEGYCVAGAEQTTGSIKLNEFRFPEKVALILGNEKTGIPPQLIPLLDVCLEIPQFGLVRSLNVHVAGATFIWEYAKQHLV